jgi:hypothetical protein
MIKVYRRILIWKRLVAWMDDNGKTYRKSERSLFAFDATGQIRVSLRSQQSAAQSVEWRYDSAGNIYLPSPVPPKHHSKPKEYRIGWVTEQGEVFDMNLRDFFARAPSASTYGYVTDRYPYDAKESAGEAGQVTSDGRVYSEGPTSVRRIHVGSIEGTNDLYCMGGLALLFLLK